MVTFEKKVLPARTNVIFHGSDFEYRYPNGSVIIVGGMETNSRIMGTEFDIIYVNEATELTVSDYEALTSRNRNNVMPYQQVIGDCNPGPPKHWLKQRAERGDLRMLESRHEDNPVLYDRHAECRDCRKAKRNPYPGYVLSADKSQWIVCPNCRGTRLGWWTAEGVRYVLGVLERLTGVRKERLRYGRWVAAEGLVYTEWDPRRHVIMPFNIPYGWRRYRVFDFGYTNPFVCQWYAEDPDGRLYLYKEVVGVERLVEDWAATIKQYSGPEIYAANIADHDAEGRATLEKHLGIRTVAAKKKIKIGIQKVQSRLRPAGDGRPRFFVFADALRYRDAKMEAIKSPIGFQEEIEAYIWDDRPQELLSVRKNAPETPVDRDNHSLDTARYMVAYLDGADVNQEAGDDVFDEVEYMINRR
jgi:phage terminase large subunit